MKKIVVLSLFFMLIFSSFSFADGFEKSGDYYRYKRNNAYVYNDFVNDSQMLYYFDENGYMVMNTWFNVSENKYYAGNTGALYRSDKYDINGNYYYFDTSGVLKYGWINDIYYANDDGYLVSGFQQLEIPSSWPVELVDNKREDVGWFYFDKGTFKKVFADDKPYITKLISNRTYCFDVNGVLRTGWRLIKDTTPEIKGYMYFVPEETIKFKFGQAVTDSWYAIEPPTNVVPHGDVKYYYFQSTGYPRCAGSGKYIKAKINTKTYLFNEYGYTVYGIKKIDNEFYYFGPNDSDCSMKTGVMNIDEGNGIMGSYYFADTGTGYSGIHNNKLYYKGKLQRASDGERYRAVKVNGASKLVNSQGVIMKNKNKIKDADGVAWSTNSVGTITYSEGYVNDPEPPEETD